MIWVGSCGDCPPLRLSSSRGPPPKPRPTLSATSFPGALWASCRRPKIRHGISGKGNRFISPWTSFLISPPLYASRAWGFLRVILTGTRCPTSRCTAFPAQGPCFAVRSAGPDGVGPSSDTHSNPPRPGFSLYGALRGRPPVPARAFSRTLICFLPLFSLASIDFIDIHASTSLFL
jgi:hypothetical protein